MGYSPWGCWHKTSIEVRVLKLGQDIQDEIQESGVLNRRLNRERDF